MPQVQVKQIELSFFCVHFIDRVYPKDSPHLLHFPEHKYKKYPSLSSCSKHCTFANAPIALNWLQRLFFQFYLILTEADDILEMEKLHNKQLKRQQFIKTSYNTLREHQKFWSKMTISVISDFLICK